MDDVSGYLALRHANGLSFRDTLRLHAHLLAEQIRADGGCCHTGDGFSDAADLIDPEVTEW